MISKTEKLIGSRVLAKHLGVTQLTVQRLAARGELPSRKVGGRYRFRVSEVERWLGGSRSSSPSELAAVREELAELRTAVKLLVARAS